MMLAFSLSVVLNEEFILLSETCEDAEKCYQNFHLSNSLINFTLYRRLPFYGQELKPFYYFALSK